MKYFSLFYIFIVLSTTSQAQTSAEAGSSSMPAVIDTSILPVHDFTVTGKDKKALLRWKADTLASPESFYAVERSSNGVDFALVGITKTASSGWTEFFDDSPPGGRVFYRIKLSTAQASFYSEMIAATPTTDASCKFYPNPVDKVLIVRSESGVDVQISNQAGKPLITDKVPGGLKVIDVSALEPGIYVITLFQKETGRQVTEKLVKK